MIATFRHKGLEKLFRTGKAKGIPADMEKRLRIRLDILNRATSLNDLGLPGYDLHPLKGDRKGEYSISVTGNYRLAFRFEKGDARDVNLEDYH